MQRKFPFIYVLMEGWSPEQFDDFLSQRNLIQHGLLHVGLWNQ